ncbi:hypothetical protein Cyrtocomes_00908 [Candidatus Cyrtobacter comes]|uniref:Flagellar assembly protein FliH/Type III secretion system HrpE domain-containing protein n=1 Tax=Candidatus Cyrtobacter comes TaxID=675776 RepID=A0ABU5L8S9_9RICK|nr:hypothetical protein [Candidatus Cyrtobacter comes]MDZ5762521.1 hypothetical protein [Candidatus Cyrtobacter comes]
MRISKISLQDFQYNTEVILADDVSADIHRASKEDEAPVLEKIDIDKIKEDSYNRGVIDTKNSIELEKIAHQKDIKTVLFTLHDEFKNAQSRIDEFISSVRSDFAGLSIEIAKKVVGSVLDSKSSEIILSFIMENIKLPELIVEAMVPLGLSSDIVGMLSSNGININVSENGDLGKGSCILNFGDGKLLCCKEKVLEEIESIVSSYFTEKSAI